ncbi:general odorant-binding protein 28a [Metopolophium dirhodum]|uniref:general odorant-binding protein 28a n=1 Tax=Metopolophium dirhodum TaxID=44670 RepID=UPI00299006C4|nr:general odorant-binding protein 28a [Metopolophium dirhodum]
MFALKVACLCLSVAVVLGENNQQNGSSDRSATIFQSCIAETKLSGDALKGFRSMSIPKTQAEKCMMGCLMRKVNVINKGKFSVEEATKVAQKYYGTNEVMMKKAKDLIDVCAKKAQSTTEECALAGIVTTCIVEEAQKAGLSGGPGSRSRRTVSPKFRRDAM